VGHISQGGRRRNGAHLQPQLDRAAKLLFHHGAELHLHIRNDCGRLIVSIRQEEKTMAGNLPNMERRVVALGFDCIVRCGENPKKAADTELAFVASFEATENFQLSRCNVLGYIGPVTIDPMDYSCTITMQGFVPNKRVLSSAQYEGGGKQTILDQVRSREEFMTSDGIYKIPYIEFYNERSGAVIASFTGVIFESAGITASANEYVRNNVTMQALYKNKEN
jgi:hypothetical protein